MILLYRVPLIFERLLSLDLIYYIINNSIKIIGDIKEKSLANKKIF